MSSYGNHNGSSYSSSDRRGYGGHSSSGPGRREHGGDSNGSSGRRENGGGRSYGDTNNRSYGDSASSRHGGGSSSFRESTSLASHTTSGGGGGSRSNPAGVRGYTSSRDGRSQLNDRPQYSSRYQQNESSYQDDDDDEVGIIKAKIHEAKTETLESSRRALRHAEQAEKTGADTLVRLGQQTEQLRSIERTLELTSIEAENSVEKSSKLRTLNKSIFHISMNKPFSGKKRRMREQMKVEAEQERVRMANERKTQHTQDSRRRINQSAGDGPRYNGPEGVMNANGEIISSRNPRGPSKSERSRYTFEDEDPELEDEINDNIDQLGAFTRRLKELSLATKAELEAQDDPMKRIGETADKTHDTVGMANFHLSKIK
ncbi:Protein transport protein S9 plasma membrane t-SNARE [Coemansia sp. RSA 1813]|nr:Protein transport protein S9 plasma membrane t-SNARE [Coemansia sp. RSA 1646]KAJ1768534.1 Protein transport protein S9 plasma membrane t-SNARE [Coemansia sp. RSA 1843]KAJ2086618.1 Protein transport protein S9 plasma membrane t-SNARE [Coemansia sp. RSA 986]KAJ2212497.1 Protein transport protein S9 plasma membrane t-SNARE [Coemansia sp. RSA 487]KAJ2565035.1 Protein transport protein S9 plasma membrane t-SNARE [Coemansia sp. RSA 1813]